MATSPVRGDILQGVVGGVLVGLLLVLAGASGLMALEQPASLAQHLVNGLCLGGLFALIALGYTMVYGIIELINFAHGEVFMVGSFLGLLALEALFGWGITSIFVALPLAIMASMIGCAALGVALDSVAYKPLRRTPTWSAVGSAAFAVVGLLLILLPGKGGLGGSVESPAVWGSRMAGGLVLVLFAIQAYRLDERSASRPRSTPRINALLSAIGMSIFLQNLVMLAVGRDTQTFVQMSDFTGLSATSFPALGIEVQWIEVMTVVSALLLMLALDLLVTRTRLGAGMRAIAQDPESAMMLGIPVTRVITMTFVVGSALAAAAGILYGLRTGGIKFNDGFIIGLKAFIAAVLGGIGNIRGAMLGGFLLGLSETVLVATMDFGWEALGHQVHGDEASSLWPRAEFHDYKDAIAFLVLIVVLCLRPSGLLGAPHVEKV